MYCLCVNVYCHRVSTQLQLTNISISINICCFSKAFLRRVFYVNQQLDNHHTESLKSYYATKFFCHFCSWIRFFFHFALTKLLVHNFINAHVSRLSQQFLFMEPFSLYHSFSLFRPLSFFHKLEFYRDWGLLVIVYGAQVVAFVCSNKCHFCVRVNSCFFFRRSAMSRKCHNKIFTLDHSQSNTRVLISFKTGWDFPLGPTLSPRLLISNESSYTQILGPKMRFWNKVRLFCLLG
jgi:hypothetical protein